MKQILECLIPQRDRLRQGEAAEVDATSTLVAAFDARRGETSRAAAAALSAALAAFAFASLPPLPAALRSGDMPTGTGKSAYACPNESRKHPCVRLASVSYEEQCAVVKWEFHTSSSFDSGPFSLTFGDATTISLWTSETIDGYSSLKTHVESSTTGNWRVLITLTSDDIAGELGCKWFDDTRL